MVEIVARPQWTFVPASSADFSERAKNVSHLLGTPLQRTQEWLACLYGHQHLHALQALLKRASANPAAHPPGPYVDDMQLAVASVLQPIGAATIRHSGVSIPNGHERERHLLEATADLVGVKSGAALEDKHRDITKIELFGPLELHRPAFARVRDKWRVIQGGTAACVESRAEDYAHLEVRESGRLLLRLTHSGRAVLDALEALWEIGRAGYLDAREEGLEGIADDHPENPWAQGYLMRHLIEAGELEEAFDIAKNVIKTFKRLHSGQLELAMPGNHYCGPSYDNWALAAIISSAVEVASELEETWHANRWGALLDRSQQNEPLPELEPEDALALSYAESKARRR